MPDRSSGARESRVSCHICLQIARAFATAISEECFVTLGSTEQVLYGCGMHYTFLVRMTGPTWREDALKNKKISLLKPKNITYLQVSLNNPSYPPLELVKKDSVPNQIGLGRVLDAY